MDEFQPRIITEEECQCKENALLAALCILFGDSALEMIERHKKPDTDIKIPDNKGENNDMERC